MSFDDFVNYASIAAVVFAVQLFLSLGLLFLAMFFNNDRFAGVLDRNLFWVGFACSWLCITLILINSAWLLIIIPIILLAIAGWIVIKSIKSVNERATNNFIENETPTDLAVTITNNAKRLWGAAPVYVLPKTIPYDEHQLAERANLLVVEITEALTKSPISSRKKALLMRQARKVPVGIVESAWKLARLRRLQSLTDDQVVHAEAFDMESKRLQAMRDSVNLLASLPLSLMRLELAHDERYMDRIIEDLTENNRRLRDQTDAFAEVRAASLH